MRASCVVDLPEQFALGLQAVNNRFVCFIPDTVDSNPLSAQSVGGYARCSATSERVKNYVAFVRTGLYDALVESNRLLRRVAGAGLVRVIEFINRPYIV